MKSRRKQSAEGDHRTFGRGITGFLERNRPEGNAPQEKLLFKRLQPISRPLEAFSGTTKDIAGRYLEIYQELYFEEFFIFFALTLWIFNRITVLVHSTLALVFFVLWILSVLVPLIAFAREIPERLLTRRNPVAVLGLYALVLAGIVYGWSYYWEFSVMILPFMAYTLATELMVHRIENRMLIQAMNGATLPLSSPRQKTRLAILEAGNVRERVEKEVQERLKAEELKTELITNISHDIRTPLTSIINFSELMKGEELGPEALDYLLVVEKSAHRMKVMVDDLFTATKTASGNLAVTIETVDFSEVLMQTYAPMDTQFREKGLELDYEGRDATVAVKADGIHLSRVIQNLLVNALNYSVPDTRVYVRVSEEQGDCRVSFTSISRQKLDMSPANLMQQFVRGDQSRRTEGSGLGLYIATNLMDLMSGNLELSIQGDAFTAILSLPGGITGTLGR